MNPFDGEDTEIGGSIEDLIQKHPHAGMSWHIAGPGFVDQIAEMFDTSRIHVQILKVYAALLAEGIDLSSLDVRPTLDCNERQAVGLGLHLVGFFAPEFRDHAASAFDKLCDAAQQAEDSIPPEARERIREANRQILKREVARAQGLTLEQYEERLISARAAQSEYGVWGEDED